MYSVEMRTFCVVDTVESSIMPSEVSIGHVWLMAMHRTTIVASSIDVWSSPRDPQFYVIYTLFIYRHFLSLCSSNELFPCSLPATCTSRMKPPQRKSVTCTVQWNGLERCRTCLFYIIMVLTVFLPLSRHPPPKQ